MNELKTLVNHESIQSKIFTIREKQVMLDRDLAELYGVDTRTLNQAVKRNEERFPIGEFMFQLNESEFNNLISQTVISSWGGIRKSPNAFTEMGIAMLSAVLRSEMAIKVSIQIMSAFVAMRNTIASHKIFTQRLETVEQKQVKADEKFAKIFDALQNKQLTPKQGIFYDGQIFDAYVFLSDLIRQAKTSIILIDSYVDETILELFTKRKKDIPLTIYTKEISNQFKLDLKKYNKQYSPTIAKQFNKAHDRFLILDNTIVYHFGASLKDLGNKWFAFSKMELDAEDMINKLK